MEFGQRFASFAFAALLLIRLLDRLGTNVGLARRLFCFGFAVLLLRGTVRGFGGACQFGNLLLEVSARFLVLGYLLSELLVGYLKFVDLVFKARLNLVAFEDLASELSDRYLGLVHQFRRIGRYPPFSTSSGGGVHSPGSRDFASNGASGEVIHVHGAGCLSSPSPCYFQKQQKSHRCGKRDQAPPRPLLLGKPL